MRHQKEKKTDDLQKEYDLKSKTLKLERDRETEEYIIKLKGKKKLKIINGKMKKEIEKHL